MPALTVLLSLLSCQGTPSDSESPVDSDVVVDSDSDSSPVTPTVEWRWIEVPSLLDRHPLPAQTVRQLGREPSTDEIWMLGDTGARLLTIAPTYVPGSGVAACPTGADPDHCAVDLITGGEVRLGNAVDTACIDGVNHQVVAIESSGRVSTITAGRDEPLGYHRQTASLVADPDLRDHLSAACVVNDAGQLVMGGEQTIALVTLGETAWSADSVREIPTSPLEMQTFGSSLVIRRLGNEVATWSVTDRLAPGPILDDSGTALAVAIDPVRGAAWIARSDGVLRWVTLPDASASDTDDAEPVAGTPVDQTIAATVRLVTANPWTGDAFAIGEDDAGISHLMLVSPTDGVLATMALDYTPSSLLPAGNIDDAVVFGRTDDGVVAHVYAPIPTPDPRPPIDVFLMTTLENPFEQLDMECASFEELLAQLRANVTELKSIGVPVAFGVTWQFAWKARDCGDEDILTELDAAGFELGYMVHDRPCFSCSSEEAPEGERPFDCPPSDPDFAHGNDPNACWPSNPDYCERGDQACWLAYVEKQELEVDAWLPRPALFILGADRHALWDWDPIEGARVMARADGSKGFDTMLFAGQWLYPDTTGTSDPRGKEPAPRDARRLGTVWRPPNLRDWEQSSAFSDLVYMPGNTVTLSRLEEWQESGLTVEQLIESQYESVLNTNDVKVLTGLMRQAAGHRRLEPSTWYMHLADLTSWQLRTSDGSDSIGDALVAWKQDIDRRYGPAGTNTVRFRDVAEIRVALDEE